MKVSRHNSPVTPGSRRSSSVRAQLDSMIEWTKCILDRPTDKFGDWDEETFFENLLSSLSMLSSWRSLWFSSLVCPEVWHSIERSNLTWSRRFNLEKRKRCKQIDLIRQCRWNKTGFHWKIQLLLRSWNRRDHYCSIVFQSQFLNGGQHLFDHSGWDGDTYQRLLVLFDATIVFFAQGVGPNATAKSFVAMFNAHFERR